MSFCRIGVAIGMLACAGPAHADDAPRIAGSYEVLICKSACAFGDPATPPALGVVVVFDKPLPGRAIAGIDPYHFGAPGEKVRLCYSGMQSDTARTLAFATKRGVSAWQFDKHQLTFELARSIDAGYEASLSFDGKTVHGTGNSWGAGVAAPGFSPDIIVARRVGPADMSWCAKSTTGFIDPRAADNAAVQRAVREFIASLTPPVRREFLHAAKTDLALFHFGAGSSVRARYFTSNTAVRRAFCGNNRRAFCNIDAASMIIVEKAWERIHAAGDRAAPAARAKPATAVPARSY